MTGTAIALRRRFPDVAHWVGWFFLFVLPVSHLLLPIGAVAAERFLYIASLGFCALAGLGFAALVNRSGPAPVRHATLAAMVIALVGLSTATLARNRDWRDPLRLFTVEAERSPRSEKARLNLAVGLWDEGKKTGDRNRVQQAESVFLEGIALRSEADAKVTGDHARLLYFYGNYLQEHGRTAEALRYYEKLAPFLETGQSLDISDEYYVWYGAALETVGRTSEALAQYETARARRPGWIVPLRNIGQILMKEDRFEEAVKAYREAVASDPAFALGYVNLGLSLASLSREDEALQVLASLEQATADTATNAYYQGVLARRLGRIPLARQHFAHALALDPGHRDARNALDDLKPTAGAQ
jgi:tetratricopeptide (TPR) repeat protein